MCKKVIIRMPNWIGDFVMALPLLEDIKKVYKKSIISVVCLKNFEGILYKNPNVDNIIHFDKKRCMSLEGNDLGVLLTNSFSSALFFWKAGVPIRIGYRSDFRSFLLTNGVKFSKNRKKQHLTVTYKELLKELNIGVSNTYPKIYTGREETGYEFLKDFNVSKTDRIIGINLGARYGSAKCWSSEGFAEVAKKLIKKDDSNVVLFFGEKKDKELVDEICRNLPDRAVNLAGKTTISELISLIKICGVFLTNDSGPMHIADALKVKVVAIFGSTDEVVTGPSRGGVIVKKTVECSPCFKRKCKNLKCMKKISVDDVFRAVCKQI